MFKKYNIIYFLLFLSFSFVGCSSLLNTTNSTNNPSLKTQYQNVQKPPHNQQQTTTQQPTPKTPKFVYINPAPGTGLDVNLMEAVETNNIPVVKELLSFGANPNTYKPGNAESLSTLGRAKTVEMAKALIEGGANPNIGCPLLWVGDIHKTTHEIVAYLVSKGANIYQETPHGETLLVRRIVSAETVRVAIKLGYNPSEGNMKDGNTSLHVYAATAVSSVDFEIMSILIDAGADVNARNKRGETPLGLAKQTGNIKAIKILLAANAKE